MYLTADTYMELNPLIVQLLRWQRKELYRQYNNNLAPNNRKDVKLIDDYVTFVQF